MPIQQNDVLKCLRAQMNPIDSRELARYIEQLTGESVTSGALNAVLTGMVHMRQVKRHHNADGILRYSVISGARAVPEKKRQPEPEGTPSRVTLIERIRALLAEAGKPLTSDQVAAAFPDRNPQSIKSTLYNGVTQKMFQATPVDGNKATKAFSIATGPAAVAIAIATTGESEAAIDPIKSSTNDDAAAAPAAAASENVASPAAGHPANTPSIERLLEQSLRWAETTREAYFKSVADRQVYDCHNAAVRAARAALDAFRAGGQP